MTDWIARDEARVWHGFTQMSSYATNRPVIVERAEGHYLTDVDGNRYLDAISSLWVTTLGHRVPGARRRDRRSAREGRPLDPARQWEPDRDRAGRGLDSAGARGRPSFPLRLRRGCRGRTGTEDRLPVLDQPGGHDPLRLPRLRRGLSRGHDRFPVGRGWWLRHRRLRSVALPGGCAHRASTIPMRS